MSVAVNTNSIPDALRRRPQWVLWRYEERDGKLTKPPFQVTGELASHTNPATWTTFERAEKALRHGFHDGIGFVLASDDPFGGVDIDDCVDPATGEIAPWAVEIIQRLNSYTEISPSGKGVRIFIHGALPDGFPVGGKKRPYETGAVEAYCRLRYLTVTGRHLAETPTGIEERDPEFQQLCRDLFPPDETKPKATNNGHHIPPTPLSLTDGELMHRIASSRNGAAIMALYHGDMSGFPGKDGKPDHSAADLALCNHLVWWTNHDADRVDRLFRRSGLMREKWDEKRPGGTYGRETIAIALADVDGGFDGSNSDDYRYDLEAELRSRHGSELDQARDLVASLPTRIKAEGPGCVFGEDVLRLLGCLRALDQAAWTNAKAALSKAKGLSIRQLEQRLPAVSVFLPTPTTGHKDVPGTYAGDVLPGCPAPRVVIPAPFKVGEGHTSRLVPAKDDWDEKLIARAAVLVTARTRDITVGAESVVLAWKWPNAGWQSRIVDRSQAMTRREVIKLASFGFPVSDDNVGDIVSYLSEVEGANRPTMPCARVSSRLGWQGEPGESPFLCGKSLVLPDGTVESVDALDVERPEAWSEQRVSFHGTGEGSDQIVDGYHVSGTLEGWTRTVQMLREFPKAQVAFYAGLSTVLLEIFRCPNFIVDLAHDTSVGKTTAARCAAAHWGNPDERSPRSVVFTWDASRVGLERASEIISGLPLTVDDTKKAKGHPKLVADLVYAVASGRGRIRGTVKGLAHTPVFRTVMISTGEQPVTSFTQDGGTRTRVLALGGQPFREQSKEMDARVKALNAGLYEHYGHSGPLFVSWLQKNRHTWDDWRERYHALVARYSAEAPSAEGGRLAAYAALISITGEMAHRALPLWEWSDPIPAMWQEIAGEASDAAGAVRALEDLLSWASSHEHAFIGRFLTEDAAGFKERIPSTVYGRWDADESWGFLAVYPTVLREQLERFGYSAEGILRSWRERGWLKTRDGKFFTDVRVDATHTKKMVVILRHAFESDEGATGGNEIV